MSFFDHHNGLPLKAEVSFGVMSSSFSSIHTFQTSHTFQPRDKFCSFDIFISRAELAPDLFHNIENRTLSRKGPSEIHIEITTASVRVLYHLQCSGNQLFLSSASAVLLVTLFVTFVSLSLSDASAVLLLSTEIFSPVYQDLNSNAILQHIL